MTTTLTYAKKPWTILLFIAADNNLAYKAGSTRSQIAGLIGTDHVHVVCEMHVRPGWGRVAVERFRAVPPGVEALDAAAVADDTGDPATLSAFLAWGRQHFPADHTALIIWGHGTGIKDLPANFDYTGIREGATAAHAVLEEALFTTTPAALARLSSGPRRGIAVDATARDYLDTQELEAALAQGLAASGGGRLDLLGFDACLMSCIEIAYQLRDRAQVMIGSQAVIPGRGWPYRTILTALEAAPMQTALDLAGQIVAAYYEASLPDPDGRNLAALDLDQIGTTYTLTQTLAAQLTDPQTRANRNLRLAFAALTNPAGGNIAHFEDRDLVDFRDWVEHLRLELWRVGYRVADPALNALLAHLAPGAGLIRAAQANAGAGKRVHGVSIYWPQDVYSVAYDRLAWNTLGWSAVINQLQTQN